MTDKREEPEGPAMTLVDSECNLSGPNLRIVYDCRIGNVGKNNARLMIDIDLESLSSCMSQKHIMSDDAGYPSGNTLFGFNRAKFEFTRFEGDFKP